ncbi:12901_t:CDS:2 [Funneliformis caledonium]|uniref:12901_t:CDS:1 n=1 Tax=Funneliformis caledonium TaxID=1117310 RepID=A0A9N9GP52_9GLOM|nr:12901_t:CDS:2 [Funneliformis caledonium]
MRCRRFYQKKVSVILLDERILDPTNLDDNGFSAGDASESSSPQLRALRSSLDISEENTSFRIIGDSEEIGIPNSDIISDFRGDGSDNLLIDRLINPGQTTLPRYLLVSEINLSDSKSTQVNIA